MEHKILGIWTKKNKSKLVAYAYLDGIYPRTNENPISYWHLGLYKIAANRFEVDLLEHHKREIELDRYSYYLDDLEIDAFISWQKHLIYAKLSHRGLIQDEIDMIHFARENLFRKEMYKEQLKDRDVVYWNNFPSTIHQVPYDRVHL